MKRCPVFLLVMFLIIFFIQSLLAKQEDADMLSGSEVMQKRQKLRIPFVVNKGQIDEMIVFYANTLGGTVFVTKDGKIIYSLLNSKNTGIKTFATLPPFHFIRTKWEEMIHPPDNIHRERLNEIILKEEIVSGMINNIKGEGKAMTNVNYFKGKDASRWKTDIPSYEVVNFGEVNKGIELKLKAHGGTVEKIFYVKPDADPKSIKLKLSGIKALKVDEKGDLVAETLLGNVKFTMPVAYQEINGKKVEVGVVYELKNNTPLRIEQLFSLTSPKSLFQDLKSDIHNTEYIYGFKVDDYDKTKDLVIDPLLASTYFGGTNLDYASSITVNADGNIYIVGWTRSSDFPTTTEGFDSSFKGDLYDAFVSKLNGNLTELLASTYLGGSDPDYVSSIAVDLDGNIYVTGKTSSSDFPTITGSYDTSFNGGLHDAFISKLNGNLTELLASTYVGGSSDDSFGSITIDPDGNIYAAAKTLSSDFPITVGTYTSSNSDGFYDVVISKFNGTLASLLASIRFGGSNTEYCRSVTMDLIGNLYVAGETWSSDFPTTAAAYDTSFNGSSDTFISKMNGSLTSILASTYLGGSGDEYYRSIATDSNGNIYVAGDTSSSDFPTTVGAYGASFNGSLDTFVSKLNGSLTSILASTYLGGSGYDRCNSIAMDSGENIYVTGETSSPDFPTTVAAYDTSFNGSSDTFISKVNRSLTSILASTYLGGSGYDRCNSITIDPGENIYVAGDTSSTDFPTTTGAYETFFIGVSDVFVSKLDSNLSFQSIMPTPSAQPSPTLLPSPTPAPTNTPIKDGKISGYVVNSNGKPIESVKIRLKGEKTKIHGKTSSDENGYFEFKGLKVDTYMIIAWKRGYRTYKKRMKVKKDTEKKIEIILKKIL